MMLESANRSNINQRWLPGAHLVLPDDFAATLEPEGMSRL